MAHQYAKIAFTNEVKKIQSIQNSRNGYASMDEGEDYNYLMSEREAQFIAARDSFYMASVSETQWPYVQHRGGPAGFLKVIDEKTLGFADFKGNRQYISTGNFQQNDRVSLILMDYPSRMRLKVLGRISIIPEDDLNTLVKLEDPSYRARVERGFIIHIEAFDWNCPQHITPRYTEQEIETLINPLQKEITALKAQLNNSSTIEKKPKSESESQQESKIQNNSIGSGPLALIISGVRQLTPKVRAFELRHPEGKDLPSVEAASHIKVPFISANGKLNTRSYSICSNPKRRDIYEIAVQLENNSKGGSKAVHAQYQIGTEIHCEFPSNNFKLHEDDKPSLLIAGGIGITPIKAMAQALKCRQKHSPSIEFSIHYTGKTKADMPFLDRMQREFGEQLITYVSTIKEKQTDQVAGNKRSHAMNIAKILRNAKPETIFYICGPTPLIEAVREEAEKQNIHKTRIQFERFEAKHNTQAKPVLLKLKQSNIKIRVDADTSLLDAMLNADITIPYSCKTGDCKSCAVKVINGDAEHNDNTLSDDEKTLDKLICPCVSRASTTSITLDI